VISTVLIASERADLLAELSTPARSLAVDREVVALDLSGRLDPVRGADRLLQPPAPVPADAEVCAALLDAAIARVAPRVVLLGATTLGCETAARLACRRGAPCANEADDLALTDQGLRVRRRCMGRFVVTELLSGPLVLATVRPRLFSPPEGDSHLGRVQTLEVDLPAPRVRVLCSQPRPASDEAVDDADRVVSVGRGLRGPEDLPIVRRLADSLGAAVGGSRPVTEHLGWLPLDLKVGLSGKTIAPELYVACGISGQIEHVVGMRDSRVVVALNSDPAAPIFAESDYYVVGDLYELLPALSRAVAEARFAHG
jgi:electron transfer flavoprotein alpha subunit